MNRDIFKPPSSLICHSKYDAKFKVFSHGLQRKQSSNTATQFDTMMASNPVNQRKVTMQTLESNDDAVKVAGQVLQGLIDPHLGCGFIAAVARKLNEPPDLQVFTLLCHEQSGHEHVGITPDSLVPAIIEACKELAERPVAQKLW
jgi:hypothetical protein